MENTKHSKIQVKNIIRALVLVAIIVATVVIYNCCGFVNGNVKSIYSDETLTGKQMIESDGNFIVVSYDGATLISERGEIISTVENKMSSPRVDKRGDYLLMYDKDGYQITLYRNMKRLYSFESEQPIKSAKVNKNGYALFVSDETGYNARITVLTPKGKPEYIWKIGDVFVVDADISPDNQKIAVAAVLTDTGVVTETMIFAGIYKEKELARVSTEGSMPICVKYTDSGSVVAVSDNKLCGYNSSGAHKWTADFESRLLSSFDIEDNGNTALALRGIKNNTIIQTYTKSGKKSGEYTTSSEVKCMDANGKYVAIFEPSKLSVISFSGKLAQEHETQKDLRHILMLSRKKILTMSGDEIEIIKM